MKWPFFRTDWRPHVLRAVADLTSVEDEKAIEEVHTSLVRSGISQDDATKLILFIPTAFAREMFEPEGVTFPYHYIRTDPDRPARRIQYRREPIFQTARAVAREFIDAQRFHEVDVVILWSAEGKLIKDGLNRGARLAQITEITHHF